MSQFYNNGVNPFNFGGMVANNMPQSGVKVQSWLQANEISELKKNVSDFSLSVSQEDMLRGFCNHRNEDGSTSLIDNGDGTFTCAICHHKFSINPDASEENVAKATQLILDLLQSIKLMYVSMPQNIGREFFQIIPLIEKIPKLYKIAANDFKRFDNINGYVDGMPVNAFALFSNMTTPGFGIPNPWGQMAAQGQPVMTGQMGPMMGQTGYPTPMTAQGQPVMTGQMGQPMMGQTVFTGAPQQNPGMNPFYAQPNGYPQYNPQITTQQPGGYALNSQGAAAPAPTMPNPPAPSVPAQGADGGAIKVDGNLKA